MDKPDFGNANLQTMRWTPERLAYLRYLAERGKSAPWIANDIFGDPSKRTTIGTVCKRFGIQLHGQRGRPRDRFSPLTVFVETDSAAASLARLSEKHCRPEAEIARLLLRAIFEQGDTFLDNLLDLDAAK